LCRENAEFIGILGEKTVKGCFLEYCILARSGKRQGNFERFLRNFKEPFFI
jgi:hypothetical protein